jgi:hypothetical protein
MLQRGLLRLEYIRATVLEGRAESKVEMRVYLGDDDHSECQRAANALEPAAMAAALLAGSGASNSATRDASEEEAPRAASFAQASTASFPAIPTCAGTQWILIWRVRRLRRRRARRAWKAARAQVQL